MMANMEAKERKDKSIVTLSHCFPEYFEENRDLFLDGNALGPIGLSNHPVPGVGRTKDK